MKSQEAHIYPTFAHIQILLIIKMEKGTVKFFNKVKGFGFITPENGGKDVFVHMNDVKDELNEGDKVSYNVAEGPKGLNAVEVSIS